MLSIKADQGMHQWALSRKKRYRKLVCHAVFKHTCFPFALPIEDDLSFFGTNRISASTASHKCIFGRNS